MPGIAFGFLSPVFVGKEGEKKHVVSIKSRPEDRFVHAAEAEKSAIKTAREWVDNRALNCHPSVKISVI